jgi:hypothetical protein
LRRKNQWALSALLGDRRIYEGVAPERGGNARVPLVHGSAVAMGNEGHLTGPQHAEIMVHDVEMEALQVGDVAGDMK